jgi:cobalt/nickel transport system permease protein
MQHFTILHSAFSILHSTWVGMSLSTSFLERYINIASPIHDLDARVKLALTLSFVLALALVPPGVWWAIALLAFLLWWTVRQARVGLPFILGRSLVALPFAVVAVTLTFTRPGAPLFQIPLGFSTLTITDAGLLAFITVLVKSWLSVQAALLLTTTTHFTDLLYGLQGLRLPTLLVGILSFAYRYLFVLVDEAQRLLRARECRSAELPGRRSGRSTFWQAAVVGRMVGTLFLRAYERSERIYVAMLSRGYDGTLRARSARALSSTERGVLALGMATCAAVVLGAYIV